MGISDAFQFQTFAFLIIAFEVTHLWRRQKTTNKWLTTLYPPHFHHLQIELIYCLKRVESANTWKISRTPHPPHFFVDIINVCSLSGFLRFGLSHAWMLLNFEFYENLVKLFYVKLSKKPSLYYPLYQLLFEQLSGEFMSVTICFLICNWCVIFVSNMKFLFSNFCFYNF